MAAVTTQLIDSVFFGMVYGLILIIGLGIGFFVWYMVTFRHRVLLYEITEKGVIGRAKWFNVRERKSGTGALLWSGRFGKVPQPPAGYTRVLGRGSVAQCFWYEGQAIWIKPEAKVDDPDFIQKLDLFTGSQKGSYVNIEEQAQKKSMGTWDRVLQMVNVSVLVVVLLVIVFSWSEISSTPKELAQQIEPISANFVKASNVFAETAEKLTNIEKGVQQIQANERLPEEPPQ